MFAWVLNTPQNTTRKGQILQKENTQKWGKGWSEFGYLKRKEKQNGSGPTCY